MLIYRKANGLYYDKIRRGAWNCVHGEWIFTPDPGWVEAYPEP